MPAAVASRSLKSSRATHDSAPPAKKAKLAQNLAATRPNSLKAFVNGASVQKPTAASNHSNHARPRVHVEETTTVVGGGQGGHGHVDMVPSPNGVTEISSADGESEEDGEEEDRAADDDNADPEELSFGDRLRAQEPESAAASRVVDVETSFVHGNTSSRTLATTSQAHLLSAPSSNSLGTVLTQALRTNDQDLLESCLRVVDVDAIYATVERLPSPLVGTLLQKLAERLHKKPGRAGMLMLWVQWSLAAHGGYLASQPHLVKQLATLSRVLKERANGLQPLLSLKGRLDMLQAQLDLRRRNQRRAANDNEDDAVIYVEGEDDYVSSEEASLAGDATSVLQRTTREDDEDDASSVDGMPTTMEVDEESEDDGDESDGLLDIEAEETDLDTGDEMSEPVSDDLDESEGVSESEQDTKLTRRSTAARAGLKLRR